MSKLTCVKQTRIAAFPLNIANFARTIPPYGQRAYLTWVAHGMPTGGHAALALNGAIFNSLLLNNPVKPKTWHMDSAHVNLLWAPLCTVGRQVLMPARLVATGCVKAQEHAASTSNGQLQKPMQPAACQAASDPRQCMRCAAQASTTKGLTAQARSANAAHLPASPHQGSQQPTAHRMTVDACCPGTATTASGP
jgi:hypothetical protein